MNTPLPQLLEQLLEQLIQRIATQIAQLIGEQREGLREQSSPWLSIESAAAYLEWPRQRLYKLAGSGAIPHYKHGNRLLFNRGELEQWLQRFAHGERPS